MVAGLKYACIFTNENAPDSTFKVEAWQQASKSALDYLGCERIAALSVDDESHKSHLGSQVKVPSLIFILE